VNTTTDKPTSRREPIGYDRREIPEVPAPTYPGERYEALVPDTLDLAERAELALNGMGATLDPALDYLPFGTIHFASRTPLLAHWASADVSCNPKYGQAMAMTRLITGSDRYRTEEQGSRRAMLSRVEDGLYWDRADGRRPWRNIYSISEKLYGKGKDEDFCVVAAAAIMLRAVLSWRELEDNPDLDRVARELAAGMSRIVIRRGDYAYYPEKGGWAEPCSYPRSGWLNTDEPQSATDGAEGDICCYHANQMYALAQWYARSGDREALDLAARLMRLCMQPKFWGGVPDPDLSHRSERLPGHIAACLPDPACTSGGELGHWFSHFHARALTLRGLLEYGRVTGDERVLEFVLRAYEFTLTQGIARLGFVNCMPVMSNMMEGCAAGDLVALGIRLSEAGLGDFWDNVDAVVRNQLMEMQYARADLLEKLAAASKEGYLPDTLHPGQASIEDVICRGLGSFGCGGPTSMSGSVMLCCTGNGSRGIYYAWEGALREDGRKAEVNLLLNRAGRLVDVDSYLPYEGKVAIRVKTARRVAVRIPHWVDARELRATVNGKPADLDWTGRYLEFSGLAAGDAIELAFPVKESAGTYTVAAHTPWETTYSCEFRGSTLVDIAPRDTSPTKYPLYLRDHLRTTAAPMKDVTRFVPNRIITNW